VVIETERLVLRRMTVDDLDELVAIHADSDIMRVFGRFALDRARSWLGEVDQNWRDHRYVRVAITDRATGRLLGPTGLAYLDDVGETELGWTVRRDAWGAAMRPRPPERALTGRLETSRSRISLR